MYHRLIILALLFPCFQGKSSLPKFPISVMLISDSLPVQFWLQGCATYNEHQADGVHHKCFCAPWQCDDEIKIQFTDDPSQNYTLLVLDENEIVLDEIPIEETSVGVYEVAYIPSDGSPEICEENIQLQIRKEAGVQGVSLPALNTWANGGGAGDPWTTGSNPSFTIAPGGPNSEYLFVDYAFIPGVEYSFFINYNSTSVTLGCQIGLIVCDNLFNIQFGNGIDIIGSAGARSTETITFVATASTTRIAIRGTFDGISSTTITLTSTEATRSIGSAEIVAKTDCLEIREDHPNTVLLNYSNHRNFAGLVYESISPENEFQIRIPAIFFHQRGPEEDEVMELSNSLLTLNGELRWQRLLDINFVPYYFHRKLKLILKHQLLTIFNRYWVKQEAYEIVEGDRRWPVKKAKCWISEKDFVHRNIL